MSETNIEPMWIVNDLGELGVKVGDRFFFLYKGRNIEYSDVMHEDDGTQMKWRQVGKREFGETQWPASWLRSGRCEHRYTVNLELGIGCSGLAPTEQWQLLPPSPPKREQDNG